MIAIVLAAGRGSRLGACARDTPKGLVPVAGEGFLPRQLDVLRSAGVDDISLVTGFGRGRIESLGVPTHHNPRYASTNMVASLLCAGDRLRAGEDVLVTYADIVYEPEAVGALLACPHPFATVVDRRWRDLWSARGLDPLETAETLRVDARGFLRELGKSPRALEEIEGQYIGMTRFPADLASTLADVFASLDAAGSFDGRGRDQMYMTSFLQHLIDAGRHLAPAWIDGGWLELDTGDDLAAYERLEVGGELSALCDLARLG